MSVTVRYLGGLALVAFVLHLVWEYLHISLYTGYAGLFGNYPVWLVAALGDVLYTLGAVAVLRLVKLDTQYPALTAAGLLIAIFVETKALVLGRWAYAPAMPLVFGLGLSPLLQMTILLPVSVWLTQKAAQKLWRPER